MDTSDDSGFSPSGRQITHGQDNCILTNCAVWSPDGEWIVYDVRSDPAGERFDGVRILASRVRTGEIKELYKSCNGACCGVTTFHPKESKVVFILGPEHPTPEWSYNAYHRQGVIVDFHEPGRIRHLDARDLVPPFTPGALRGGSHVHVWEASGEWVSFTYEDHVLAQLPASPAYEANTRNLAVSVPGKPISVTPDHPRNHSGDYFSVVVTQTKGSPAPGSDEISRACEEGWVGTGGYLRTNGTRQNRALAFQGWTRATDGSTISEVYVVDLPDDVTRPGDRPLEGSSQTMPSPPQGARQRRLTFTSDLPYPGIQGPRHWLRSSPDGARIAFLMKDEQGIVQLWSVSPNGGRISKMSNHPWSISSSFTWSPDGCLIAHAMDNSIWATHVDSGHGYRLTEQCHAAAAPRPEACVFSPQGDRIAYVRQMPGAAGTLNQIFVVDVPETLRFH